MKRIAAALLVAASGLASAAPLEAFAPMAFLAGHCWKGTFADGKQTDEHCFTWLYEGKALRDVHTVRAPGRPDYVGETIYYWDSAQKRVDFLYVENGGGISRGSMVPSEGALTVPSADYVADGKTMTYRARWTPMGDDAYEAWSEARGKDGWTTMFRMVLRRTGR